MSYIVITWPEIQELMGKPGFRDNSYLINDDKGIKDFGSSAYFVDNNWLAEYGEVEQEIPYEHKYYLDEKYIFKSVTLVNYDKKRKVYCK